LKKWQENSPRIFLVIFSMSPSQQLLAMSCDWTDGAQTCSCLQVSWQ